MNEDISKFWRFKIFKTDDLIIVTSNTSNSFGELDQGHFVSPPTTPFSSTLEDPKMLSLYRLKSCLCRNCLFYCI